MVCSTSIGKEAMINVFKYIKERKEEKRILMRPDVQQASAEEEEHLVEYENRLGRNVGTTRPDLP